MRLTVIGCGHLGATQAACMAEIGHQVLGLDIDEDKVALLNSGRAWFGEPGLDDVLARNIRARKLRFTANFPEAAGFAAVHLLCVPTPGLPDDGACDLTQVFLAVRALAPHLARPSLIIGKSTVPPGTAALAAREVTTAARFPVEVAWVPEFGRRAHAISDTLKPSRIVAGVPSPEAEATIRDIYRPLTRAGDVPLIITDPVTAELLKEATNAFLAAKISLMNAMSDLCAASGADATVLSDAVGLDPRIGRQYLISGLGYGGGWMPQDIRGLAVFAKSAGAGDAARLLTMIDEVNTGRRQRVVDFMKTVAGPLRGKRIAVWGGAFKPGTDDVLDSPGLDVADRLTRLGAEVVVYDPSAGSNAMTVFPHLSYADSALAAAFEADAVLIVTAWPEFSDVNPAAAGAAVRGRLLIDACQAVRPPLWKAAGWTVASPYSSFVNNERTPVTPA